MHDQGVPLKGREAHTSPGDITAALKTLRHPPLQLTERHQIEGVPASLALAPVCYTQIFPGGDLSPSALLLASGASSLIKLFTRITITGPGRYYDHKT